MKVQEKETLIGRIQSLAELAEGLNAIDDALFRKLAEDRLTVQEILRTVMGDGELVVEEVVPQRAFTNLGARSVALDALCRLGDKSLVVVEVQKRKEEDAPRRVRYVRSSADTWLAEKGIKFVEVPWVAAVYISRLDPFRAGRTLYHVDKVVRETGEYVDDGTLDIYVNAEYDDGGEVARLMRYMMHSEGELEGFPALTARVQYFKHSEEGKAEMSDLIEEYARQLAEEAKAEGLAEGKAEGLAEGKAEGLAKGVLLSLKNLMANLGLAADAAMDALGVPEDERASYRAKLA